MNYSKNKNYWNFKIKRFILKGFLYLIGVFIGVLLISGVIHLFGCEHGQLETEAATYGTIDGKVFTKEVSMEWTSGSEHDFVPLDVSLDEETQEFIYYLSNAYNIDFPFVMALIKTESSFNPSTISSTNDYGLMQINKINHERLKKIVGVTDYLDPHQNVRAGMFMLRKLFEKYEDPTKVLMAYNMGETGASSLWKQGVYETVYSKKIMKQAVEYKQQISEKKGGEIYD